MDNVIAKQITFIGFFFFPGTSVSLYHFHCVHHAAIPVGVYSGVECYFLTFPHHCPHSATHDLQWYTYTQPCQSGKIMWKNTIHCCSLFCKCLTVNLIKLCSWIVQLQGMHN